MSRVMLWATRLFAMFSPLLVGLFLLGARHNATLFDLVPAWSDDIMYWHQSQTFATVGFESGYYAWDENPAPLGNYYAWGLWIPALYGVVMRLFGITLYSIPLINYALLMIAGMAWVAVTRPTRTQSLVGALVLATFTPLVLYSASSMAATLHNATGIALAAGFYALIQHPRHRNTLVIVGVLLFIAVNLRITWGVLCVPYALIVVPRHTWRGWVLGGALGVLLMGIMAGIGRLTIAPYPLFFQRVDSVGELVPLLLAKALENLRRLDVGTWAEVSIRVLPFILLIYMGIALWQGWRTRNLRANILMMHWVNGFSLGGITAFGFLFYEVNAWNDFRLFAPHILLALLLLVAFRHYVVVGVAVAFMLWGTPETLAVYDQWTQEHLIPARAQTVAHWQAEFAPVLAYDDHAESAWCNTLSHSVIYLYEDADVLLAVPAGIGLSSPLFHIATLPYKARWLLIENGSYERRKDYLNVRPIMPAQSGWLYENLDAACG